MAGILTAPRSLPRGLGCWPGKGGAFPRPEAPTPPQESRPLSVPRTEPSCGTVRGSQEGLHDSHPGAGGREEGGGLPVLRPLGLPARGFGETAEDPCPAPRLCSPQAPACGSLRTACGWQATKGDARRGRLPGMLLSVSLLGRCQGAGRGAGRGPWACAFAPHLVPTSASVCAEGRPPVCRGVFGATYGGRAWVPRLA